MKKLLTITIILIFILIVGSLSYVGYYYLAYPKVGPAPSLKVELTPERIERGRYLCEHIYVCFECHSERNWDYFAAPEISGTRGKGGEKMSELAHPGKFYIPNITPFALKEWSDGELLRVLTSGVDKDNHPIYYGMPYFKYNHMPLDDLKSIIAYLRTLAPIANEVQPSKPNWSIWQNIRMMPMPYHPDSAYLPPNKNDTIAYGEYLAWEAACVGCHTPTDEDGNFILQNSFAGGYEFILQTNDTIRSSNITPDSVTGIGRWSKEDFINRFKFFEKNEAQKIPGGKGKLNTTMPWTFYAGMKEDDLGAIYAHIRTIEPIYHKVEKFSPGK